MTRLIIKHPLIFGLLLVLAGFCLGGLYFKFKLQTQSQSPGDDPAIRKIQLLNPNYKFARPLLAVDISEKKEFEEFRPLKKKINDAIEAAKADGKVWQVGVYFRDLETGRWAGVNENEKFAPASIMKVVLMIAFYKSAETSPSILSQTASYDGKIDNNASEIIKSKNPIQASQPYTLEELIKAIIIDSDNNAMNVLLSRIDISALNEIATDLNINTPFDQPGDLVSPKQISLMFRVLYNTTYLKSDFSERALAILAQSNFKNGLVAGLPDGLPVAHKFGERLTIDNNNITSHELHDCGIIYFPSHPYFLCIMTKGPPINQESLQSTIADLSRIVYEEAKNKFAEEEGD